MPRLLALVLALLLPLQLAWSAAAAYCQHETVVLASAQGAEAPHLGHHAHQHQAAEQAPAASAQNSSPDRSPLAPDPDCGVCHALALSLLPVEGRAGALPAATLQAAPWAAQAIISVPARVPDRPQWPHRTA